MSRIVEADTGALFGSLWAGLTDEQYAASVDLFVKRARANDFDLDWIRGKRCLDAGCGSGRYAAAIALHGAQEVVAVDISEEGLNEAARRTKQIPNIFFQRASVLDLPFSDEAFDLVWSAGVIHHTEDFERALKELVRVIKPGGKIFLLVYGAGGLRWKAIKALRAVAGDLGSSFVGSAIDFAKLPANNRKHFIDDLFVPIQILTDWNTLKRKLEFLGLGKVARWTGETFDHEQSAESQLGELQKLRAIGRACEAAARNERERYLGKLFGDIASVYVETALRLMDDSDLSSQQKREIMIGQGNHRVVAEKRVDG